MGSLLESFLIGSFDSEIKRLDARIKRTSNALDKLKDKNSTYADYHRMLLNADYEAKAIYTEHRELAKVYQLDNV